MRFCIPELTAGENLSGHQLLIAPAADYRSYAFHLLYQAADLADPVLETFVEARTGKTIGEYLPTLAVAPPPPTWLGRALRRFPPAMLIARLLRGL